jgi:outer membrane protein OmpA-like peptidoglycan-associated protein
MTGLRALVAAAGLLLAHAASADDPTRRGFDPDPVRPALSLDGGWAVETAETAERGRYGVAFLAGWTEGLLALRLGDDREQLLESRVGAHLLAAWSLGDVELGAGLPVTLWQRADFGLLERQGVTGPLLDDVASFALGDLRLGAKWRFLRAGATRAGVALAALGEVRLPTGDEDAFTGDGLMFVPGAVATRAFGPLRVDAQVGYQLRRQGQYAQLVAQDGLVYALGGALDLPPLGKLARWRAHAELGGGWPRGDLGTDRHQAPLSARALVRAFLPRGLAVELGGGAGLGEAGFGREAWRVFAGVRWAPAARPPLTPVEDRDGDGVANTEDACPDAPGLRELDGCPDADRDEIPDREDACPDRSGPASANGCPPAEDEPLVTIETERLTVRDAIQFDTAKDSLKPQSFRVLNEIATMLREHADVKRVRVEGHTDDVGRDSYNKDLSQRRAASVVRYLTGRGIAAERLVPVGYGEERPIAPNATALGRAKNRRVEFTILAEGEEGGGEKR